MSRHLSYRTHRLASGVLLTLIAAVVLLLAVKLAHCADCGVLPVKPLTPVGCRNIHPECQCDATGTNCGWVWVCDGQEVQ